MKKLNILKFFYLDFELGEVLHVEFFEVEEGFELGSEGLVLLITVQKVAEFCDVEEEDF